MIVDNIPQRTAVGDQPFRIIGIIFPFLLQQIERPNVVLLFHLIEYVLIASKNHVFPAPPSKLNSNPFCYIHSHNHKPKAD